MTTNTSSKDRDEAVAWIARQLRWERTLAGLRHAGRRDAQVRAEVARAA